MFDPNLKKRVQRFLHDRAIPSMLHLDLLYACDLNCQHCYLDQKSAMKPVKTEAIIDVLEQGAELGALNVLFSGGEIFLRKDLMTLIEAARALHYCIQLKTHGGRVTREDAIRLKELGVKQVDFSVYALDDEVHDAFTQKKGSLKRTLQGIDYVADQGITVKVNCSVTKYNKDHYQALTRHFTDRGILTNLSGSIRGTNSLSMSPCSMNMEHDDQMQLRLWVLEQRGGPRERPEPPPDNEAAFCGAGSTLVYVAPNLKVYPCVSFPMEVGDLTQNTLREIWHGSSGLDQVRATRRSDTGVCGGCPARKQCEYCPGKAYIANKGDWKTPTESTCDTAFIRKDAADLYRAGERANPIVLREAKHV